jgi:subtilisin family serine protease
MDIGQLHGIDATVSAYDRKEGMEADVQGPGKPCVINPNNEGCGHGSHVAGVIAAEYIPKAQMYGVCPVCKIISIRVADRVQNTDSQNNTQYFNGGIGDSSQIRGFTYLFNLRKPGKPNELIVNVINGSFGKFWRSQTMSYVVRRLQEYNVILTAAAGNENTDIPSYPAAYQGVVSVCALGVLPEDNAQCTAYDKASFSNFGDWVSLCAPGTNILSTVPGDPIGITYAQMSGTSQASPFTAGTFGMMLAYYQNNFKSQDLIAIVKKSSDSKSVYNAPCNRNLYSVKETGSDNLIFHMLGSGMIDMAGALSQKVQSSVNEDSELGRIKSGCVMSSVALSSESSFKELLSWIVSLCGILAIRKKHWKEGSSTDH